jgi:hypothetical protein
LKTHFILVVLLVVSLPLPAYAYLDPASGSMLLQLVLGGVAGIALAFRLFWHRILALFGKKPDDGESSA